MEVPIWYPGFCVALGFVAGFVACLWCRKRTYHPTALHQIMCSDYMRDYRTAVSVQLTDIITKRNISLN